MKVISMFLLKLITKRISMALIMMTILMLNVYASTDWKVESETEGSVSATLRISEPNQSSLEEKTASLQKLLVQYQDTRNIHLTIRNGINSEMVRPLEILTDLESITFCINSGAGEAPVELSGFYKPSNLSLELRERFSVDALRELGIMFIDNLSFSSKPYFYAHQYNLVISIVKTT
jgi:hypothetical protein